MLDKEKKDAAEMIINVERAKKMVIDAQKKLDSITKTCADAVSEVEILRM